MQQNLTYCHLKLDYLCVIFLFAYLRLPQHQTPAVASGTSEAKVL